MYDKILEIQTGYSKEDLESGKVIVITDLVKTIKSKNAYTNGAYEKSDVRFTSKNYICELLLESGNGRFPAKCVIYDLSLNEIIAINKEDYNDNIIELYGEIKDNTNPTEDYSYIKYNDYGYIKVKPGTTFSDSKVWFYPTTDSPGFELNMNQPENRPVQLDNKSVLIINNTLNIFMYKYIISFKPQYIIK